MINRRTYHQLGQHEDYVYIVYFFFPCMALPVAKVSFMATFCHEKGINDTVKNQASQGDVSTA